MGRLVGALEARGLGVYLDREEILDFEGITGSIERGLARSKALLAYYPAHRPSRRPCQWELIAAFLAAQRQGDPRRRVLVVREAVVGKGGQVIGARHTGPPGLVEDRANAPARLSPLNYERPRALLVDGGLPALLPQPGGFEGLRPIEKALHLTDQAASEREEVTP